MSDRDRNISLDDILDSYDAVQNYEESGLSEFFETDDAQLVMKDFAVSSPVSEEELDELRRKAANITKVPDEELSEEDRKKKSKQIDYEIMSGDYERRYVPEELKTSVELEAERQEQAFEEEQRIREQLEKEKKKRDKKEAKKNKKKNAPQKLFGLDLLDPSVKGLHSSYDDEDDFDRKYGSAPLITDEEKDELIGEEHIIPYDIGDESNIRTPGHSLSEKMELSEYSKKYADDKPVRDRNVKQEERHGDHSPDIVTLAEDLPVNDSEKAFESYSHLDDVDRILAQYDASVKKKGTVHSDTSPFKSFTDVMNKFLAKEEDSSAGELGAEKIKRVPPSNAISRKHISDIDLKLGDKILADTANVPAEELAEAIGAGEDEAVSASGKGEELSKIQGLKKRRSEKVNAFKFIGAEDENTFEEEEELIEEEAKELQDFESVEDIQSIASHIEGQKTHLIIRLLILIALFAISVYIAVANDYNLPVLKSLKIIDKHQTANTEYYLFINSLLGIGAAAAAFQTLQNGLKKMYQFKADCDSLCVLPMVGGMLTSMICLASENMIRYSYVFVYTPVAIGALIVNTIGKLLIVDRTARSFANISADTPHYALFIENDDGRVQNFTRGALTDIPVLAGMQRTEFISDFLRTSYASDSTDRFCKKVTPFIAGAALVIGIIAGILGTSEHGGLEGFCIGLSAFTAVSSMCCCYGIMLVVNLPLNNASKEYAKHQGAVLGFESIDEFSDTNAVLCDAAQLFPAGSIRLINIKTFPDTSIDEAILQAASLTHQSGSILDSMFYEIIGGKTEMLFPVESYLYEDSMGLCGWINNKRVLLGNRELMINHSIEGLPSVAKENEYTKGRHIAVYLSISGSLSGMFIVEPLPAFPITMTLHRLSKCHINMMLRSVDSMLTVEYLSEIFDVNPGLFKLIPFRYHPDFAQSVDYIQRRPATLVCTGKFPVFVQLVTGAKKLRTTISVGIAVQIAQILLGILLVLALVLLSSASQLTATTVLIYNCFFTLIYILFTLFRK